MGGRDALIEELRATVARLEAVIEQQAARIAVLELELAKAIPLQDQLGSDETSIKDNGKMHCDCHLQKAESQRLRLSSQVNFSQAFWSTSTFANANLSEGNEHSPVWSVTRKGTTNGRE